MITAVWLVGRGEKKKDVLDYRRREDTGVSVFHEEV